MRTSFKSVSIVTEAEGPSFIGDGSMAKYHDIIEVVDPDTYLFAAQYQDAGGRWIKFMRGKHTRRK